jgi:hypothetical protein
MGLFDAIVTVDWSAANRPGPAGGAPNGIWVAVAVDDRPCEVAPHATRAAAATALRDRLVALAQQGRRALVGVDVAFGYPAGTAAALGCPGDVPPWRAVWDLLAARITDDAANRSNRFAVAAALNARVTGPPGGGRASDAGLRHRERPGPFWGVPARQAVPGVLVPRKPALPFALPGGGALAEHRATERALRAHRHHPKSVWQLYGAGSVGSQSLLGIPRLAALRDDPALAPISAVWPFETGFTADPAAGRPAIVHAEVYPSLVDPDPALHPVHDARQVLALADALRRADAAGDLASLLAGANVPTGDRAVAVAEEGWILGVRPGRP